MVLPLPGPMPVGAHIRLFRWSLLIAGVVYGFQRKQELQQLENELRRERMATKFEREAKIAEERKIAAEKEYYELSSLFIPDDNDDD